MRRAFALVLFLGAHCRLDAQPLVDFPTDNRALAAGRPQDFYMFVERDFEGEKSYPWQGGQFGYVRGPRRAADKIIYTHLHEGVDIRPVQRDPAGNPTDQVRAAADGKVVHASTEAGASNYGRYVVVEHRWNGSPYYTLYAHLASIAVTPGQIVRQGEPLGIMGFTGAGIDRKRAHVHFEVCMLLSRNFESWHDTHFGASPNRHGIYNGLNLAGADPSRLLLEARKNPSLKIADYFASDEPAFSILINDSPHFSLIRDYPWLVPAGEIANPPAWKITFSRAGVPLKVEAHSQRLAEPRAAWVKETPYETSLVTKGYLTGPASSPRLTESGMRFARLLTWPD